VTEKGQPNGMVTITCLPTALGLVYLLSGLSSWGKVLGF